MSAQLTATKKVCQDCQREQPAAAFFPSSLRADGLTDRCKRCVFDSARQGQERRDTAKSIPAQPIAQSGD